MFCFANGNLGSESHPPSTCQKMTYHRQLTCMTMIKEVTKGKVYWKATSKLEVEDLETLHTFYSSLA